MSLPESKAVTHSVKVKVAGETMDLEIKTRAVSGGVRMTVRYEVGPVVHSVITWMELEDARRFSSILLDASRDVSTDANISSVQEPGP